MNERQVWRGLWIQAGALALIAASLMLMELGPALARWRGALMEFRP